MTNDLLEQLSELDTKQLAKTLWEHAQYDQILYEKCELLIASKKENKLEMLIRKKIKSVSNSSQYYDWRHAQSFANELDYLRETIVNDILPKNPKIAAELLEEFILQDGAIIESVDDSSGWVGDVLHNVVDDWGLAWQQITSRDVIALADKIYDAFINNNYGVRDGIIHKFAKALGSEGINHIEQKLKNQLNKKNDNSYQNLTIRIGLIEVAESKQDMEMYIEHVTNSGKSFNGMILDKIIEHFIEYNRAEEALVWLNKYKDSENKAYSHNRLMLKANQCLGNDKAIKENHWKLFNDFLNLDNFNGTLALSSEKEREYYRTEAIKIAQNYRDAVEAISFLTEINAFDFAVQLLHDKYSTIDGRWYHQLHDLADIFEERQYLLETILIYRRLAESILARAKAKCYHYAVSYIRKTEELAGKVVAWKHYPTPSEFIHLLRQKHGRKYAFWSKYG